MLRCSTRACRKAWMLSELRWGSIWPSSTSNPGASLTSVAERKPPMRAVARIAIPCRAIFRPSMVQNLLFSAGSARFGVLLARSRFGVMSLFHGIHPAIGFREEPLDVVSVFGAKGHSNTQADQIAAANVAAGL